MKNNYFTVRRIALGAAGLLGAGLGHLVTATPAAAVPALTRVASTGAVSSADKAQTATCPAGRRVLGGGYQIAGGAGQVGIEAAVPTADRTGFTVAAREDGTGFGGSWSLTAVALCGWAPAGLEYVSYTWPAGSTKGRWTTVTCSTGKHVIGLGGRVNNGAGQVVLAGMRPDAELRTVRVDGFEDQDGYPADWSVTAVAVCANRLPGLELAVTALDDGDAPAAGTIVTCPTGKRLHGVGGNVENGTGAVRMTGMAPTSLTHATVRGHEDETGLGTPWVVVGYGICAT